MGAYTIVADFDTDTPAKKIADKAVLIDATDVDAIVDFCRKEKVDGITTGFVDILLPGWIEMCKKLDLPCYANAKCFQCLLIRWILRKPVKNMVCLYLRLFL